MTIDVYTSAPWRTSEAYTSYPLRMPENTSAEIGIRELRESLSDVLMDTAARGRVTYVTNRGRRMVAIVPLPFGEAAEDELNKRLGNPPA